MNLLQDLMERQLSGGALEQISRMIGANPAQTQSALAAVVPTLMSAMARNVQAPGGADALHTALRTGGHDGGLLDDMMGFLGNPQAANGAGILGHLLGGQEAQVQQGLSRGTGLSPAAIATLMTVVAPMLMGAMGRAQRQQGLDVNGLAGLIGGQQQAAQAAAPDLMGMIGGLIDTNHDGNVVDDLGGLAARLFGGR